MYLFNSRVRYSEIDPNKKLDLAGIINYFQDCSTFQSESLNLGFDFGMGHYQLADCNPSFS